MNTIQEISIPFLKDKAVITTYENGYTFVFVPKKGEVFNINTWVKTGSIHEDDENNGVSHFLEHLMFKGTQRFKAGEFDRIMESMGAVINAATWKDFTFYYITGPNQGSNFETALDLHADMLLFSTIPTEEVGPPYNPDDPDYAGEKRERTVVIEEIGMREDSPWSKIFKTVNEMMYPDGHPYQRDVIGTRQIIGTIPQAAITSYYRTWYSPQNLVTIVVGDFEYNSLEAKIRKYFDFSKLPPLLQSASSGQLKQKPGAAPEAGLNGNRPKIHTITGEFTTHFFNMAFHGPKVHELREGIALDIASYILGEGRSSRLTQALLEKPANPVFNTISCGQSAYHLGNVFYIQGNFGDISPEKALESVHAEIKKMLDTEPITSEELSRAVKKLKVDFAETSETAAGIAEEIGESITVTGSVSAYIDYLSHLQTMDLETVRNAAKRYINLDNAYTSVLVPQ